MRLIYYFDTWAIIWHGNVPVFLKICTDLQEICSICSQNCFCYCFCSKIVQYFCRFTQICKKFALKIVLLLFLNNFASCLPKIVYNNFALKCCKFLANLWKSSEILEQCLSNDGSSIEIIDQSHSCIQQAKWFKFTNFE